MHLEHITLGTGHSRRSSRSEVSDAIIAPMVTLVGRALVEAVPIPSLEGYLLKCEAHGKCLSCGVSGPTGRLVTFGVAGKSRCGAALWSALLDGQAGLFGNPSQQPGTPWLAVRFESGLMADGGATTWLGDFERCIAWAWLESQK